jgi:hypothetical protein
MELARAIVVAGGAVRLGVSANVAAVWSQSADRTALTDPVTGPAADQRVWLCAARDSTPPNRQIRSLVTVGSCTDPLGRTSLQWMELSTLRSDTRAGGGPVSRIRRSDPGCRGEDLIQPGAHPVAQSGKPRSRGNSPHHVGTRTSRRPRPRSGRPHRLDGGRTLAILATAGRRIRKALRRPATPQADSLPPAPLPSSPRPTAAR